MTSFVTGGTAIDFGNGNMTNVDIDSGAIDGVTIGGSVAPTVTDLGSVATCDINGGSIDGTAIGASSATTIKGTTLEGTTSIVLATGATCTGIADEDDMTSNSDTLLATQQSIKAYVDSSSALELVASTSPSAVSVTGDMTVAADNRYLLTFSLITTHATNPTDIIIRFNNDSGTTDYAWSRSSVNFSTSAATTVAGDDSDSSINLAPDLEDAGGTIGGYVQGSVIINTNDPIAETDATVGGQYVYSTQSVSERVGASIYGTYKGGAVTSVELGASESVTGELRLYKFANA